MAFVRDDFLLPPSINDVGPSTPAFFHGGEIGRGVERLPSASFRFFDGGSSLFVSTIPSSFCSPGVCINATTVSTCSGLGETRKVSLGSGVTRSSCCEVPFGVPFCISCHRARKGAFPRQTPTFPAQTRAKFENRASKCR